MTTSSSSTNLVAAEESKLSVASSTITKDWDLDEGPSNASLPPAAISILQGRSHIVTENWDDDFEDSRNSPAKRRPIPNRIADEEPEESWDEEDDEELNEFGLAKKDEEDKAITARSRRTALARASEPLPPLPIPPPLLRTPSSPRHPHPFPRTPSSPGAPRPRSRSPTSTASVFSVPNTVLAYSYLSTTHLNSHQRGHRPNSAFALLPPSPPIHKERERRRLRKKSRPRPQGVFELTDAGMSAEQRAVLVFRQRDGGTEETVSSIDENPEEDPGVVRVQPIHTTRIQPAPISVPATPTKGGAAATMLSRIGSVKKWGVAVRNRRRGSTNRELHGSPMGVFRLTHTHTHGIPIPMTHGFITHGTNPSETAAQQDNEGDQELQRTPRPRSSLSSFNAESSSHSHSRYIPRNFNRHSTTATGTPGSPTTSSSPWFFRASSTGSPTSSGGHMGATGLSRGLSMARRAAPEVVKAGVGAGHDRLWRLENEEGTEMVHL
ncbi:hypothetical protein CPC08DRAFT_768940 [Agrocybe pediades]|nr:hypothetical protein CPC08DRAFT_768940 [Agrocybe pediades]